MSDQVARASLDTIRDYLEENLVSLQAKIRERVGSLIPSQGSQAELISIISEELRFFLVQGHISGFFNLEDSQALPRVEVRIEDEGRLRTANVFAYMNSRTIPECDFSLFIRTALERRLATIQQLRSQRFIWEV